MCTQTQVFVIRKIQKDFFFVLLTFNKRSGRQTIRVDIRSSINREFLKMYSIKHL